MAIPGTRSLFWAGARDASPFTLVVLPFGVLFGVLAVEAGLNVLESMSFSVIVIAGAAQLTALQLMQENAPTLIVLASALAVNLRMAMYSAALMPHLGPAPIHKKVAVAYFLVDQSFALSAARFDTEPAMPLSHKLAYFAGTVAPTCPLWYLGTWLGAALGTAIPPEWALDFAVPITFIALVMPMLRSGAHRAAALVSVALSLMLVWMPFNTGLLVAGVAAMMTGARVELWQERRAARGLA